MPCSSDESLLFFASISCKPSLSNKLQSSEKMELTEKDDTLPCRHRKLIEGLTYVQLMSTGCLRGNNK